MPFTNYALDRYFSQHLSALTKCSASEIEGRSPQSRFWVSTLVLNSMFRHEVKPKFKRFAFVFLRRAEMAFDEYDRGRESLREYLAGPKDRCSVYFRALYHFEAALAQLWQAHEYMIKFTGERVFQPNDGTPRQRLNQLHNQAKHFDSSTMPEDYLHVLWITNDGLSSATHKLDFCEIESLLLDVSRTADMIANPGRAQGGGDA